MLKRSDLHEYQVRAVEHIKQHPQSMLWLDMGLGKTIATLTAVADMFNQGLTGGVLVVAPLRVIQSVWEHEAKSWEHTQHLTFSTIHGKKDEMSRAMNVTRHIYLVNYEGLPAMVQLLKATRLARGLYPLFDMIIFDEVTRLKSTRDTRTGDAKGGMRGEALLSVMDYFPRRVGLTGTPAPNGLIDLFGQYLMVDAGQRLGRSIESYTSRFFAGTGYGGYKLVPTSQGKEHINNRISDITLQMKGEDYLELPKIIEDLVTIEFPPKIRSLYDQLELELFAELDSGASITAVNTLSLMSKSLQLCNGAIYPIPGEPTWEKVHALKLDALEEIYDSHGQSPLLVAYHYIHDKERIVERFKGRGEVVTLDSSVKGEQFNEVIRRWNAGEIPFLVGHPQSIGHGVNLQLGSNHIVLFGLDYNLEYMQQFIGRLARQGQPEDRVFVHKILIEDTLDMVVLDALAGKEDTQEALRNSVKTSNMDFLKKSIQSYRQQRGLL